MRKIVKIYYNSIDIIFECDNCDMKILANVKLYDNYKENKWIKWLCNEEKKCDARFIWYTIFQRNWNTKNKYKYNLITLSYLKGNICILMIIC